MSERLTLANSYGEDGKSCEDCEYFGEPNGRNREDGGCDAYTNHQDLYQRLFDIESILYDADGLEEYRIGNPIVYVGNGEKPDGLGVELADCIIRILDTCAEHGIDIGSQIVRKHEYNKTRPYKHGAKII